MSWRSCIALFSLTLFLASASCVSMEEDTEKKHLSTAEDSENRLRYESFSDIDPTLSYPENQGSVEYTKTASPVPTESSIVSKLVASPHLTNIVLLAGQHGIIRPGAGICTIL